MRVGRTRIRLSAPRRPERSSGRLPESAHAGSCICSHIAHRTLAGRDCSPNSGWNVRGSSSSSEGTVNFALEECKRPLDVTENDVCPKVPWSPLPCLENIPDRRTVAHSGGSNRRFSVSPLEGNPAQLNHKRGCGGSAHEFNSAGPPSGFFRRLRKSAGSSRTLSTCLIELIEQLSFL